MLTYIAIIYCIIYFVMLFMNIVDNRKIKKIDYYLLILFFMALVYIGYHLIPLKSNDLYRHYGNVNWYRSGMRDINVSKNEIPLYVGGEKIYVYELICWMVSLQTQNGYLQVIYLSIDFLCIFEILRSFTYKVHISRATLSIYIIIYFAMIPFIYSYSGLRFSTMCNIMGVGFYKYYYENGKFLGLLLLYIISFSIHPAVLIYLLIQIWYECTKNSRLFFSLIMLWGTLIKSLSAILKLIPIQAIKIVGKKLDYYIINTGYSDKRLMFASIIFLLFVYLLTMVLTCKRQHKKQDIDKIVRLCSIAALIGIGCPNSIFLSRMMMVLGSLILPFIYWLSKRVRFRLILYFIICIWGVWFNIYYTVSVITFTSLG